jgi:hypothetical protein
MLLYSEPLATKSKSHGFGRFRVVIAGVVEQGHGKAVFFSGIEQNIIFVPCVQLSVKHNGPAAFRVLAQSLDVSA